MTIWGLCLAGQLSTVVLLASVRTVELETEELISFFAPNYHYALHEVLPGFVAGGWVGRSRPVVVLVRLVPLPAPHRTSAAAVPSEDRTFPAFSVTEDCVIFAALAEWTLIANKY